MTDEEIIAVVTAHKEGKTIEYCDKTEGTWHTCPSSIYWNFVAFNYRIKPESHYRPFKSAEEVMEAIKEHGSWVKVKTSGRYVSVHSFECDYAWFGASTIGKSFKEGYEVVVFADGTPFGKLVEE